MELREKQGAEDDGSSACNRRMAESRVHYIRIQAMCVGFDIPPRYEFADDTKDSEYILVHENGFPVSTCRVRIDEENAGHIERVATLEEYRGKHYGALGIKAAEQLLKERGVTNIRINSREKALGFYEKLDIHRIFPPAPVKENLCAS